MMLILCSSAAPLWPLKIWAFKFALFKFASLPPGQFPGVSISQKVKNNTNTLQVRKNHFGLSLTFRGFWRVSVWAFSGCLFFKEVFCSVLLFSLNWLLIKYFASKGPNQYFDYSKIHYGFLLIYKPKKYENYRLFCQNAASKPTLRLSEGGLWKPQKFKRNSLLLSQWKARSHWILEVKFMKKKLAWNKNLFFFQTSEKEKHWKSFSVRFKAKPSFTDSFFRFYGP